MSGRSRRLARDLSLYLVVGPDEAPRHKLVDLVVDAVAGGVTMVQLRRKDNAGRAFVEQARAIVQVLRPLHVPLVVNDRVDVALAAGADGVHVGQDDMSPADARRLMGGGALIGLSITSLDEARAFDDGVVDYVGVGPVFATPTKPDAAPPLGIDRTRDICSALRGVPSVAIGGISCTNAAEVLATGVHGLAVVSAICGAPRPRAAAAELAKLVRVANSARAS